MIRSILTRHSLGVFLALALPLALVGTAQAQSRPGGGIGGGGIGGGSRPGGGIGGGGPSIPGGGIGSGGPSIPGGAIGGLGGGPTRNPGNVPGLTTPMPGGPTIPGGPTVPGGPNIPGLPSNPAGPNIPGLTSKPPSVRDPLRPSGAPDLVWACTGCNRELGSFYGPKPDCCPNCSNRSRPGGGGQIPGGMPVNGFGNPGVGNVGGPVDGGDLVFANNNIPAPRPGGPPLVASGLASGSSAGVIVAIIIGLVAVGVIIALGVLAFKVATAPVGKGKSRGSRGSRRRPAFD
jgi:hypothetical protein